MKTIGLLVLVLGILVLIAGAGYSLFLIDEQSRPTYECKTADRYHTQAEKAEEAYKAAKGTPREKELEKDFKQQGDNEQLFVRACSESQAFYKTRITLGFLMAGGGFVISLVGLGVFLFGRKKTETIE